MRFALTFSALALQCWSVAGTSSDPHKYNIYSHPSSNPCGDCTFEQPFYNAGWWTTASFSSIVSIEAVTVMIYTNNRTNTTRTSTIFNFPPNATFSATNSDGLVMHTQVFDHGTTNSTAVLTWPTGYVAYQSDQGWAGTLPFTVGKGLNATTTCSTVPRFDPVSSLFPTPIPPVFPTPIKGAEGQSILTSYNSDSFYTWVFAQNLGFAECEWPFADSYAIKYWTVSPDFPIYQTCWGPASGACGAGALKTAKYLTVTSHAEETQTTASSTPAPSPSPAATTSVGAPKTTSAGPTAESENLPTSTPRSSAEPASSKTEAQASLSKAAESPSVVKPSTSDKTAAAPTQSSTATSFHVTTNEAGTTVAVVNTKSAATATFSSFRTTTDSSGNTVAVVQPPAAKTSSSTATAFQITTNSAGTTVAVVGTNSNEQTTFASFSTTTDQSGKTVAVVQPAAPSTTTISSFQLTTNEAGSTVAVISSESNAQETYTSFLTTTNEAGQTVAVVQPAPSPNPSPVSAETLTTDSAGQTAAVVTGTTTIPLASYTVTRVQGGSTQTLTGTAAIPNSGGKPFLYTSSGEGVAATLTTDASGHTVIEIPTQSVLPIVTNSAGSSFVESVEETSTTITAPFTYTSGSETIVVTPSKGHSVVTYETTESIPLAPSASASTSSSSTGLGGYVASGIGVSGSGGPASSESTGPSSTGVGQTQGNAATRAQGVGSGHALLTVVCLACAAALF